MIQTFGGIIMANSYIPRADDLALVWMKTFAGGIGADPARYMLSAADVANLQAVVDAFDAAFAVAKDPGTRTVVSVMAKDQARNVAEQLVQTFYSLLKPNAGIADPDKIAIGVRPLNRGRTKTPQPWSEPVLSILGCTPQSQTLRYRDRTSPESSRKPPGVTFLELMVAVADGPAKSVDEARPAGLFTRNPIAVGFESKDDRKKATYWARWVSRRGETGPWSSPVSMSIAA
jgi:hypothetical protein